MLSLMNNFHHSDAKIRRRPVLVLIVTVKLLAYIRRVHMHTGALANADQKFRQGT
jgi:hypothetical protein